MGLMPQTPKGLAWYDNLAKRKEAIRDGGGFEVICQRQHVMELTASTIHFGGRESSRRCCARKPSKSSWANPKLLDMDTS